MRRLSSFAAVCLFPLLLLAAPASAGIRMDADRIGSSCSIDSSYGLQIDARGLRLHADADADDARLRRIEVSDGALRIDGEPRAVSAADAARLRGIESGVRGLLPDIAAISREAIAIAFDALGGVNLALNGNRREARDFERMRERALLRVDGMLERGEWSSDAFGDDFEAGIEEAAEAMVASFTPVRAIWMVVSGGVGRLERRMEKMEKELERSVAAREAVLEGHALALCGKLEAVQRLQDAMELRLDDGKPLRVFEVRRGEVVMADRGSAPPPG